MDNLDQVDLLSQQIYEISESIVGTLESLDNMAKDGLGLESNVFLRGLQFLIDKIKQIGRYILEFLGLSKNSTLTLRGGITRASSQLKVKAGRKPIDSHVTIGNEANSLLVGDKVPRSSAEYINGLREYTRVLDLLRKQHVPAVSKATKALVDAYEAPTDDLLQYVLGVGAAADTARVEQLVASLRMSPVRDNPRFSRNHPVFKGPNMLGNKSIYIDAPILHQSGYVSDLNRVRFTARTRLLVAPSTSNNTRVLTEMDIPSHSQEQLGGILREMDKVLEAIDNYPKDMMQKELRSIEVILGRLISTRGNYTGIEDEYMRLATRIARSFSGWVTNPHTQLITGALHVCRASLTMVNKQIKNY